MNQNNNQMNFDPNTGQPVNSKKVKQAKIGKILMLIAPIQIFICFIAILGTPGYVDESNIVYARIVNTMFQVGITSLFITFPIGIILKVISKENRR